MIPLLDGLSLLHFPGSPLYALDYSLLRESEPLDWTEHLAL